MLGNIVGLGFMCIYTVVASLVGVVLGSLVALLALIPPIRRAGRQTLGRRLLITFSLALVALILAPRPLGWFWSQSTLDHFIELKGIPDYHIDLDTQDRMYYATHRTEAATEMWIRESLTSPLWDSWAQCYTRNAEMCKIVDEYYRLRVALAVFTDYQTDTEAFFIFIWIPLASVSSTVLLVRLFTRPLSWVYRSTTRTWTLD